MKKFKILIIILPITFVSLYFLYASNYSQITSNTDKTKNIADNLEKKKRK